MQRNLADPSTGAGVIAILLWSATFAFARSLTEQIGPLSAGATAYLIGGVFCLLRLALSSEPLGRFRRMSRRYLFGCGALFVFYTAAIYLAVGLARSREQVLEVALVNYLWPALTVLLSLPLLKMRASLWLVPGTALSLAGIFLVMTQGGSVSWGSFAAHARENPAVYLLAFAAAVSWALYSNLARRWSRPGEAGAVEVFVPVTGLVLLGCRVFVPEPAGWNPRVLAEAVGLAAVTALAYYLWDVSMRRGNVLLVAACSYLTPLLSTVVSCAYLGVRPGRQLLIGCFILVTGSLITWRSVSDRQAGSVTT